MVDDVEAFLALRIIDPRNIDDRDELRRRIVAMELERLNDARGIDRQRQLAKRERDSSPRLAAVSFVAMV